MHPKAKVDGLDPTYKVSPPRALCGVKNKSAPPLLPSPPPFPSNIPSVASGQPEESQALGQLKPIIRIGTNGFLKCLISDLLRVC